MPPQENPAKSTPFPRSGLPRFDQWHGPLQYMHWAKARPRGRWDLATSGMPAWPLEALRGAKDDLQLSGRNEDGYPPLVEAIAAHYQVPRSQVATATGASGANFLTLASLLRAGDEILIERPAYGPLLAIAQFLQLQVRRFDRVWEEQFQLNPDRIAAALTPETRLVLFTNPHNPTGAAACQDNLTQIADLLRRAQARALVDEVYLDALEEPRFVSAARLGQPFLVTSSLTKIHGLPGLRRGWTVADPATIRACWRMRDVVDGNGAFPADQLAVRAWRQKDHFLTEARTRLNSHQSLLRTFMQTRSDLLEWIEPPGGPIAFPRLRSRADTRSLVQRLLDEGQTSVVPGQFFEMPDHIRIGLGMPTETVTRGLEALGKLLEKAFS